MPSEQRIGLIGLDTSHVIAFTNMLNRSEDPWHVPGGRVVAAFQGGSPDFPPSRDRVEGFTRQLVNEFGVELLDSPEAVAERVDLLFITSVDGRTHLDLFRRTAPCRRPTFIDKPMALSVADARQILDLAAELDVAVMSCSSLRYAEQLTNLLAEHRSQVRGIDVYGPMALEPMQPGYFWYGIHSIEMIVTVMGVGCTEVRAYYDEHHDLLTATWADGRCATLRGARNAHNRFGGTLHLPDQALSFDASAGRPYYAGLLAAIMQSLPHNRSAVPAEQMLEVMRLIEAANQSRQSGRPVPLPPA